MHNLTVAELIKGLKNKDFSSLELTQHYLKRINNSELNAFISITEDEALSQAKDADKKITQGDSSILTGIPYAHKDIFCTKGVKTSAGSKMLDSFISPYDATVTKKLNNENMVTLFCSEKISTVLPIKGVEPKGFWADYLLSLIHI